MAKLADALDLGSSALWHGGSSPFTCTKIIIYFFLYLEEHKPLTIKDVDMLLNTNVRTSQRILKQLIEKNIIKSEGSTNNLTYYLK